ncbi:MAG: 16S rRNA (guanine(527)-N(7))-methyltransferase RsmG [Oscillospiraceae bacterium]|nr:16S rRNA (guanine(527)-N(7))-methyltransferase RsmG [Oscillospiraceae bacterium]
MDLEIFREELEKQAKGIQVDLSFSQIESFYKYMRLLIEWNAKINLTAITEPGEVITKHFIDSLAIHKHIKDKELIIDVGTGAGFPGVPLKIARADLKVVLLDSLNKRILFLEEIIKSLRLGDVTAIHSRAEDAGRSTEHRELYDVVTSRAVAPLNSLVEYMSPLVKVGGKLICMKGPKLKEEIEQSNNAMKVLGLEIVNIEEIKLPNTDIERNILIIEKRERTSELFPRKMANIRKVAL